MLKKFLVYFQVNFYKILTAFGKFEKISNFGKFCDGEARWKRKENPQIFMYWEKFEILGKTCRNFE